MKFSPDYTLSILTEEEFGEKFPTMSQQLAQCRKEGTFSGFDGKPLYYEYFEAQDSHGSVVIVHGLSEFTAKYHEFAWYLLNQGYDVFLYDQRCHGRSCRLTKRSDMIHVGAFSHYRKDLDLFVRNVVRKVTHKPLYLYAHSMGGAVAAQYLAHHPEIFSRAVLSAPMFEPFTGGVPIPVARHSLWLASFMGMGKKKFWGADEFDPDYPFERSSDESRARFQKNMGLRLSDSRYCTTPLTIRWVQQSVSLRRRLTSPRFLQKIQTPILLLSAELDGVVNPAAHKQFAENCPVCCLVVMQKAKHAMLCGTDSTIRSHVQMTLDHFRGDF